MEKILEKFVHFKSDRLDWETPDLFFQEMEKRFGPFSLDVCALPHNAKCGRYYSPEHNALFLNWEGVCWMNPPYARELPRWLKKAVEEVKKGNAHRIVCLLPSRTDTAWWHDIVMKESTFIEFIRGRLKFKGAASSAPFPSAIVVFGNMPDDGNHT